MRPYLDDLHLALGVELNALAKFVELAVLGLQDVAQARELPLVQPHQTSQLRRTRFLRVLRPVRLPASTVSRRVAAVVSSSHRVARDVDRMRAQA